MNTPRRVEHQLTDKGYVPVYTTAVVEQPWGDYTATDHEVWATLFKRQREILPGRASKEFLAQQEVMGMSADRIHGSTRFANATAVAGARGFTADAPADRIVVVEGQAGSAWVAGFTAAALSGQLDAPIVLVNGDTVPDETGAFLADAFVPTDGPVPVTCIASAEACEAVARLVGFGS